MIARRLIKTFSVKGDTILDPLSGCGSTQIAAEEAGRLVGEFTGGERCHLPQFCKRGGLRIARARALRLIGVAGIGPRRGFRRLQMPGQAKMLDELQWLLTAHASFQSHHFKLSRWCGPATAGFPKFAHDLCHRSVGSSARRGYRSEV